MKKKYKLSAFCLSKSKYKFLVCMKLVFLCTLACCMQVSAKVYSQNNKIDLKLENVSVARALHVISKKSDYRFLYNNDLLPAKTKLSISATQKTVPEVLAILSGKTGLHYHLLENKLIAIGYEAAAIQKITGTVTDSTGNPLVGVTIQVKGSTLGTVTDAGGNFTLEAPDDATLVVSYIGYETQEVKINGQSTLQIRLSLSHTGLNEVVVVGYGTQKKSDLTGSVASVNMEKAEAIPTTNVAEMLRGRAAGVEVTQVDPRPGGTSSIHIRGTRSILGGNAPLFVVDGVPVQDINDINAEDIASVEVLKDASAQAIYGARASNGVILITTKRGKSGKIQLNYHGYYTIQKLTKNFDLYSPEEFAQLRREAYRATNFIHNGKDEYLKDDAIFNEFERESLEKHRFVNWEDLVLRNAKLTSHDLSMRGGTDKSKYFSSVRYFDQDGLIPTSGYKRGSFRFNFDQTVSDKLSLQADISLMTDVQNIESSSLDFITISPLAKAFNDDGSLNEYPLGTTSRTINPLWNIRESKNQAKSDAFRINLVGNYHILKNLNYKLNTSLSRSTTDQGIYLSREHSVGVYTDGKATINNSARKEFLVENILNYDFNLGEMNQFDVTAMQGVNQIDYLTTQTIGTEFTTDVLKYNGLTGALNTQASRTGYQRRLLSYMGRIRYSLADKYLFTFTGRSDGSSVFAADKKRGFFPSAAFAWKINQENFLKNNRSIDQLKFRMSYGSIGNEAIAPYQTLGIVDNYPYVFGGTTAAGYMPGSNLPNPNLTWETSTTFNAGLDFSFMQGVITGSLEYYNTHTRDLLVDVSLPGNTGYSSTITNGGESKNSGVEALLTANIIRSEKMNWSVTATFSRNRNEILKTGLLDKDGKPKDDIARNRFVGKPIDVLYEKKFDGIFQNQAEIDKSAQKDQKNIIPGDVRVIDKDKNGTIDDDDNFVFRTAPDWYGSISTSLNYKGFDLMADLYVVQGATKLNPYLAVYENGGTLQGSLNGIKVPYWTPEHPSKSYPRPQSETQSYLYALAVQDASYVRLRTLTLGYNLPASLIDRIRMNSLKVYITATNLFTITHYKSYSPEVNPNSFPDAKAVTFGINIGL